MKYSKKNIITLIIGTLIALFIVLTNLDKIGLSLRQFSAFETPAYKLILMCIAHVIVWSLTIYLFLLRLFMLFNPNETRKTKWNRIIQNYALIVVLLISIVIKTLLFVAQFVLPQFLFELSMSLGLHDDWYGGSPANMPHHFFAWLVIFWMILLPVKLIKGNKMVIFPKI